MAHTGRPAMRHTVMREDRRFILAIVARDLPAAAGQSQGTKPHQAADEVRLKQLGHWHGMSGRTHASPCARWSTSQPRATHFALHGGYLCEERSFTPLSRLARPLRWQDASTKRQAMPIIPMNRLSHRRSPRLITECMAITDPTAITIRTATTHQTPPITAGDDRRSRLKLPPQWNCSSYGVALLRHQLARHAAKRTMTTTCQMDRLT